jgi:hypothetical protein
MPVADLTGLASAAINRSDVKAVPGPSPEVSAGLAPASSLRPQARPAPAGLAGASIAEPTPTGVVEPVGLAGLPTTSPGSAPTSFTGVAGAGKGYTDVIMPDGTVQRREGARNWRNNNPGNIEYGDFAKSLGAIGSDGRFAVFPTYEAGRAAKSSLLFDTKGYAGKTIYEAISRYAPASDNNDPVSYAATIARAAGVDPNTPLADLTPSQREAMLTAMERVEGGGAGSDTNIGTYSTYSPGLYPEGLPLQSPDRSGVAGGLPTSDKAYADRNTLGQMMYDPETNKLSRNALLSLASGVGAMLSSPSQFLLPSIGLGLQGAAGTFAGLEKQAADVGLTQAETRRSDVGTDVSRFFTIGNDGIPMVVIGPGRSVTLDQYLKNPQVFSTGDPEVDARILSEARDRSQTESSASSGASPAQTPATVFSTPVVQDYITGETQTANMNFSGARASSNERENAVELMAEAARVSRPSLLLQADAVAGLVSPDATVRSGALGELKSQAIRYLNEVLSAAGQDTITGPDDIQILQKAAIVAALEKSPSGVQELNAILAANPNATNEPQANAKLMSTLMLSQQRAVDMADFTRRYRLDENNPYRLVNDAAKAFDEVYRTKYLAEEAALQQIILNGSATPPGFPKSVMEYMMDPSLTPEEKNLIIKKVLPLYGLDPSQIGALSSTNGQIDIARYFGG